MLNVLHSENWAKGSVKYLDVDEIQGRKLNSNEGRKWNEMSGRAMQWTEI